MKILKFIIFFSFISFILNQNNYPMMPNPGYDTITVHPVFGGGNENISPNAQQNSISIIMTNGTITVNTTNMDPQCNVECYTGCRILFPEFIEQKYCIINVCKCRIIEKEVKLPENNNNYTNNSKAMDVMTSEIHKYSTTAFIGIDKNNKNSNEYFKNETNNFYWIFYFIIFFASFGYEYLIYNYISEKNEFCLLIELYCFINSLTRSVLPLREHPAIPTIIIFELKDIYIFNYYFKKGLNI